MLALSVLSSSANAATITFVGLYEGNDGTYLDGSDMLTDIATAYLNGDDLSELDRVDWNFGPTATDPSAPAFTNPQSDGGLIVTGTTFKPAPDDTEALTGSWSYTSTTETLNFITLKFDNVFALYDVDGYVLGETVGANWDIQTDFIGEEVLFTGEFYGSTWNKGKTNLVLSHMTTYTVVPVPAAVWLFGSGLLGLVGVARRKAA